MTARTTGMSGQRAVRLLVCFSAAMLFAAPALKADPITTDINYSTKGWISSPFIPSFLPPISFVGASGTLPDFHSIDLGRFNIVALSGITTTFTDTPFGIDFHAPQFDKIEADPTRGFKQSYGMFTLYGRLNGTVDANGQSNVVVTFDKVETGPSPGMPLPAAGLHVSGLPFGSSDVVFPHQVDLSNNANAFRIVGLNVEVVPEPSTSLVFLVGGSALGAWRLRRRGSARRAE